ncbi:MAG: riboflavin synthase, partial [Clostridia bacterium]|nr:riboflavin synthase [Clostridia bacterium]
MFTGLVEELGTLTSIVKGARSARLLIGASRVLEDGKIGDSIAVNGVCLTVVAINEKGFQADVMAETLNKSNLGDLRPGEKVNLERALRLSDRLGGHLVSGHIDGVGKIIRQEVMDIAIVTEIEAPPELLKYIIPKGSVAIDGISLTVVSVEENSFTVSLIPHTAKVTSLGFKQVGDKVNLETDIIGKYIERMVHYQND